MYGKAKGDFLDASSSIRDHDELLGGRGGDTLDSTDGDHADTLKGGRGFDTCFADSGDVVYSCEDLDQPPPEGGLRADFPKPLFLSAPIAGRQTS